MFRARPLLGLLGLLVAAALPGCRSLDALRQKCLTGDTSACEAACRKGLAGEGGCFHAGEQLRARASNDYTGADFRTAAEFFKKSCDGGYADGCLFAAQSLESPYAVLEPGDDATLPKMMPDPAVHLREERLRRACALGSARGCKRLGDVLIGKNAEAARVAYGKACTAGTAPEDCDSARKHEVETAEKLRVDCLHRVADACTGLGNLLFAVDPPRAIRLFASECELRGVADLVHGPGAFIRARARQASGGIVLPRGPGPSARPPEGAVPVEAHALRVQGDLALVEIERALGTRADDLTTCFAGFASPDPLRLEGELVVDRTGDVYRASITGGKVPADVIGCAQDALETILVSEPKHGPVLVEIVLTRAAPAAAAAPGKKQ